MALVNYLIINEKFNFSNKALNKPMENILKEYRNAQKGSENVAKALMLIKENELWRDDFDTFKACIDTFGIKCAQAYRVISAYKTKHDEETINGCLDNFNISQVAELDRLEKEIIADVVNNGDVTPTMSCNAIRDYVNALKKNDDVPVAEEVADGASDADEATETIPVVTVTYNGDELPLTDKHVDELIKWLTKREYI